MGAKKKKSKKRSAANFKQQPSAHVFFLDRNMGRHVVADALRAAGQVVEVHDDHLPPDASDEEWLSLVGRRKWIAITKDRNIRYRQSEKLAVQENNARVLVLRSRNTTGEQNADLLVKNATRIHRFCDQNEPPFIAGMTRSGAIKQYDI